MKPLSKSEFAKLMAASRELALRDKQAGVAECLPMHCADFKALIAGLSDGLKSKSITEYATAFNGYRLNVRSLPGMFSDNKEY